jgi:hypothetical protein
MPLNNLEPQKYKRFFAFGCSFTNYHWPTWADIIGQDVEFYENWGEPGAGNHFIFNSVIEANARHNFNKDDLIMIMWTTKEREDRYLDNKWVHSTPNSIEKDYGSAWVKKYYLDPSWYIMRDMAFIESTHTFLQSKDVSWASIMWPDLFSSSQLSEQHNKSTNEEKKNLESFWRGKCKSIYLGAELDESFDFIDGIDIVRLYRNTFLNIVGTYDQFFSEFVPNRVAPDNDHHPTPKESLMFLDWIWPNNTLSNGAKDYANDWEIKIFEGKVHSVQRPKRF